MNTYIVSYDLLSPDRNYTALYSELTRMSAKRVLYSQWLVKSSWSAIQLKEHFSSYIDSNDRILVNAISRDYSWAGHNLITSNLERELEPTGLFSLAMKQLKG